MILTKYPSERAFGRSQGLIYIKWLERLAHKKLGSFLLSVCSYRCYPAQVWLRSHCLQPAPVCPRHPHSPHFQYCEAWEGLSHLCIHSCMPSAATTLRGSGDPPIWLLFGFPSFLPVFKKISICIMKVMPADYNKSKTTNVYLSHSFQPPDGSPHSHL